jgi:pyruvate/2-oxoglutarate dehydrogenase complex dihydrolipoamide dehydrogenase (E3) component
MVPDESPTWEETMPTTEYYDVLVIGSGEAGKYLAWTLSKDGYRTALVERKMVGGSCPNVACLPSKNIIHGHVA